jgi:5'(3')-deoxyribonucleotidase
MSAPRFRVDPLSATYVTLVDIVFGFTISQGFIKFVSSIQSLDLSISNLLVLLAYAVVILSWLGYHQSVSRYPYNKSVWSRSRLTFDLVILALYAFLISSVSDVTKVLLGLSLIFSAYVITGIFRIKEWSNDRKVSRPELSFAFGSLFGLMTYVSAFYATAAWVPWFLVILSLVAVFGYREVRRRLGYPRLMVVGVDVDGVLGDQVSHVLNRLHALGKARNLQKSNITDWNYPLDGSDIAREIEEALLDKRFVKEMPVVAGSIDAMEHLHEKFHVVVATSRPKETESETLEWLRRNFQFHEFVNARDIGKENLGLDVLIDDNLDNIKAFAVSSNYALLFSQEWNQSEDNVIKELIKSKRVIRCSDWNEVEKKLGEIQKFLSERF